MTTLDIDPVVFLRLRAVITEFAAPYDAAADEIVALRREVAELRKRNEGIAADLWRIVVASGVDTDGDGLEWYLRAKGLDGLAKMAADGAEQLSKDYDYCLEEIKL